MIEDFFTEAFADELGSFVILSCEAGNFEDDQYGVKTFIALAEEWSCSIFRLNHWGFNVFLFSFGQSLLLEYNLKIIEKIYRSSPDPKIGYACFSGHSWARWQYSLG